MLRARLYDRVIDGVPEFDADHPRIDDPQEREKVARFLSGGSLVRRTTGQDVDRLDPAGRRVVPMSTHTDGTWIWNAGLRYYVEVYGISPEDEFLRHMAAHDYFAPEPTPEQIEQALTELRSARPAPR